MMKEFGVGEPMDEKKPLIGTEQKNEPLSYTSWGSGTKLAFGVLSALAVMTAVAGVAQKALPPSKATTEDLSNTPTAPEPASAPNDKPLEEKKVVYGDLSDDEVYAIFQAFIHDFKKPYLRDAVAVAERHAVFKENLVEIDALNRAHPMATFGLTQRADWTKEERDLNRGVKSAAKSKVSSTGESSWDIMKKDFPDQESIALGEQGPGTVQAAAREHKMRQISGEKMSEGEFAWISEDDCAACRLFPHFEKYTYDNLPEDFDWRALGAVGQVENQKYCGSCWSFSTAQDISGAHFLATGELLRLSEQQLVACDVKNWGCDGGYPFMAMQYISQFGGMVTEADYPYKGICAWDACGENPDGQDDPTPTCHKQVLNGALQTERVAHVAGYQLVAMGAEYEALAQLALVRNGPLSVAFNAAGMDYYLHGILGCDTGTEYTKSGCISDPTEYGTCDPTALDHAVLLVGYGVQDGIPYWVIKNSWGSEWGEDGYYRLLRGSNTCGVANFIVHSVVKSAA